MSEEQVSNRKRKYVQQPISQLPPNSNESKIEETPHEHYPNYDVSLLEEKERNRRRVEDEDTSIDFSLALIFFVFVFIFAIAFVVGGSWGTEGIGRKVEDTRFQLRVTLQDIYLGKMVQVEYPGGRQVICNICQGKGGVGREGVSECHKCQGRGYNEFRVELGPQFYQTFRQTCDVCNGRGTIIKHVCPKCNGRMVILSSEDLNIQIPKGVPEGYIMTLKGKGSQVPGLNAGDVVIEVASDPHPIFRRGEHQHQQHLHHTHTITLKEALMGFRHQIKHLDGHSVVIERHDVTSPTTMLTLEGEGLPIFEESSSSWLRETIGLRRYGNLFVDFRIEFPNYLTPEQKTEISALLSNEQ